MQNRGKKCKIAGKNTKSREKMQNRGKKYKIAGENAKSREKMQNHGKKYKIAGENAKSREKKCKIAGKNAKSREKCKIILNYGKIYKILKQNVNSTAISRFFPCDMGPQILKGKNFPSMKILRINATCEIREV